MTERCPSCGVPKDWITAEEIPLKARILLAVGVPMTHRELAAFLSANERSVYNALCALRKLEKVKIVNRVREGRTGAPAGLWGIV